MQISKRWHQILGSHAGGVLSTATDCNVFAVETSAGLVVFDAGAGIDPQVQRRAFEDAGFGNGAKHLFLTHGHADHAGGAQALVHRCEASVHAGPLTALWLATGDEEKVSLQGPRRAGVYADDYVFGPVMVDHPVADGVAITIGDVEIVPIATPGHSADHYSYLVHMVGETTLIAGDALFAGGTVILQDTWDSSVADTCASIRKLAGRRFNALLSGHGPPVLDNAASHVAKAMQRIDRLLPPLNFI